MAMMKHCPLPHVLGTGWIGPVREHTHARRSAARLDRLQHLIAAGWYVADSTNIARNVLAAAALHRRH